MTWCQKISRDAVIETAGPTGAAVRGAESTSRVLLQPGRSLRCGSQGLRIEAPSRSRRGREWSYTVRATHTRRGWDAQPPAYIQEPSMTEVSQPSDEIEVEAVRPGDDAPLGTGEDICPVCGGAGKVTCQHLRWLTPAALTDRAPANC